MILLDSNVIIDLMDDDAAWRSWSSRAVAEAGAADELGVTQIVIAEVAPRVGSLDRFIEHLAPLGAIIVDLSNEAAFAAGKVFEIYRQRRRHQSGKTARRVLPDFLIGAEALTLRATILTRDPRFYRSYFPDVPLITPETTS